MLTKESVKNGHSIPNIGLCYVIYDDVFDEQKCYGLSL